LESGEKIVKIGATILNRSRTLSFRAFLDPTSFEIRNETGIVPWKFISSAHITSEHNIKAGAVYDWAATLPLSIDSARYDILPGFAAVSPGSYVARLIIEIEWNLSIGAFSAEEHAAIDNGLLPSMVESNAVSFSIASSRPEEQSTFREIQTKSREPDAEFCRLPNWLQLKINELAVRDPEAWIKRKIPALGDKSVIEIMILPNGEEILKSYFAKVLGRF